MLVLGSGMVAGPLVDYLHGSSQKYQVTIASNVQSEAEALAKKRERITVTNLDVRDAEALGRLIRASDCVVSFIPATLHPIVAELCVAEKKNLVTASYVSPQIAALHDK